MCRMKVSDLNQVFIHCHHWRYGYILSVADINHGNCFNWALFAYHIYGGQLCSVRFPAGGGTHAFLLHEGKFYDSQTYGGARRWTRVRGRPGSWDVFTSQLERSLRYHSREEFVKFWPVDISLTQECADRWRKLYVQMAG